MIGNVVDIDLKSVEDFVTSQSFVFWQHLGVNFLPLLASDPSIWDALEAFKKGIIRTKGLR